MILPYVIGRLKTYEIYWLYGGEIDRSGEKYIPAFRQRLGKRSAKLTEHMLHVVRATYI